MRKYNFVSVLGFIMFIVLISSLSVMAADPVVFRFATDNNIKSPLAQAGYKMSKLVNERTGGEVQIEVYHSGQLGDDRDVVESIQLGGDMIGATGTSVYSAWVPEVKLFDLPFLFRNTSHAEAVFNGEIGRRFDKYYEENGFKILTYMDGGFRDFSNSKRPVYSVEDIKGLKVRLMQTPYYIEAMKEFGAEVIVMPYSELFMALKQGIVDGQENNATLTYTEMMHTMGQKYWSPIHYAYCVVPLAMNLELFNKLTPEQQDILIKSANDAAVYEFEYYRKVENEYMNKLREEGVTVPRVDELNLSGFYKAAENVWEKLKDEFDIELAHEIQNYGLYPVTE